MKEIKNRIKLEWKVRLYEQLAIMCRKSVQKSDGGSPHVTESSNTIFIRHWHAILFMSAFFSWQNLNEIVLFTNIFDFLVIGVFCLFF